MNGRVLRVVLALLVALLLVGGPGSPALAAGPSTAVDDLATVQPGGHVTLDLSANDDLSGAAPHTFTLVSDPALGTATLDAGTGHLSYTAGPDHGRDTFTYELSDSDGSVSDANVSIDVSDGIVTAGPLTKVVTTPDLNCAVNHVGDNAGEFFGDTACGTFAVVDGTLYSPANIPAGQPGTAWTPVSQSAVTGTGSNADPLKRTTVVSAGNTGVNLTQVDTYVIGQESYRTDVTVQNTGGSARTVRLYRAADCYLADSDSGLGAKDDATGSVSCVSGAAGSSRIEQFQPLSAGSHYFESFYSTVWSRITALEPFPDTCDCTTDQDNGAGLSWDVDVPAGASRTRSSLITFSPTGALPLTTTKTVDDSSVTPGSQVAYTITVHNPGATTEQLATISDTLPAGFAYIAGSTTGVTTANPASTAGTLTWGMNTSVPAGGDVSLTFHATASSTTGTFYNNAGGTANDVFVTPTGNTAPVTVASTADTTPTGPVTNLLAVAGDGQVQLSWENPTAVDFDHVRLFYKAGPDAPTSPSDGTEVTLAGPTVTSATVDGLTNGQAYTFALFAYDTSDNVSDPASATATPVAPGQVSPVSNLQVAGAGGGKAVLTWDNPANLDGIVVRYSQVAAPQTPSDGTGVPVVGTPQTATISGLTNGTLYYFSVFAKLGAATSAPESVEFTPYTCPDLTPDLDAAPGLVTGQSWVACSAPDANQAGNTLSTKLTRTGTTQALMTSGDSALASPPDAGGDSGRDNQTGSRGAFDVSIYKIGLNVPAGASCLSFDYVFASEEYPEFVGQSYNDGFLAQLDQNAWTVDSNSSIDATGNFAKSGSDYVSVNSPVFGPGATVYTPPDNGTGYDGMSVPLQANTPITPGAHSIYLSIFDAGDGVLDSAAFVDHLRTSATGCTAGSNQSPVAQDDTATTNPTTAVSTNVLNNDTDGDGDALTITGKTNGAHGTVTCSGNSCSYTPDGSGFTGDDHYTYTVSDGHGGTDVGAVTVTVVNRAPNAVDDTASAVSGTAKSISVLANDTDADGHTLTVTAHGPAGHGAVDCGSGTSCTYTGTAGYAGSDSFTYTVSDGHGGTDTATVNLTVTAPAPVVDHIDISASPGTSLQWPQTATITGVARTASNDPVSGKTLKLYAKPSGGSYTALSGALVTGADGKVTFDHRPTKGTTYQWRMTSPALSSTGLAVTVTPAVTAHASTTKLASGAALTISGTASPVSSGAPVKLQRFASGVWSTLQTHTFASSSSSTTSGAAYSFRVTQTASKVYTYRVLVPANGGRLQATATVPDITVYKAAVTGAVGSGDEYVQVKNTGTVPVDLAGWKIKNAAGVSRTLPAQALAAGSTIRVHSGTGSSTATDLYLGGAAFLGNTHDTVKLYDNRGTRLSTFSY